MSRFRFLTTLVLVLMSLSFSPAAATAQTGAPFPGAIRVGGDWVPCDHPIATKAGLSCRGPVPTIPTSRTPRTGPPLVDGTDPCPARLTPYMHPDTIAACKGGVPRPPVAVFRVGGVYYRGYPNDRAVVLSITRSVEDVEVVTLQWLFGLDEGEVFALRMDRGIGPWFEIPR